MIKRAVLTIAMVFPTVPLLGEEAMDPAALIGPEPQPIEIEHIGTESTDKFSLVTLKLNGAPTRSNIQLNNKGSYAQTILPNVKIGSIDNFIDAQSPYLSKIALFSDDQDRSVLRVFSDLDASDIIRATELEYIGNRIVLSLDHTLLGKNKTATAIEAAPPTPSLEQLPLKQENKAFNRVLQKSAIASGVLLFLALMLLSLRRVFRNRRILDEENGAIAMKVLNSISLSPRQKLSVIQIGEEQLLFSQESGRLELIKEIHQKRAVERQTLQRATQKQAQRISRTSEPRDPKRRTTGFKESAIKKQNADKVESTNPKIKETKSRKNTSRINVSIGDDGIQNNSDETNPSHQTLEDVTQIIRNKLKNLPNMS